VRLPVLAGTATTLVVLVPLVFLSGFVGKTFGPLALTLLFAFTSSVAVALVLVPTLTLFAGPSRLDRAGGWIARPFQWLMDRVRNGYVWLLRRALRQRVLSVAAAVLLTLLGVLALRRQGADVLPKMDGGSFFVSLETPSGTSIEQTERVVREVEQALKQEPEVVTIQSQIGFEPGMRSFSQTGAQGPTQGFVSVTLTPRTERSDSIWEIEARTRRRIAEIPGIRSVVVRELGNTAKSTTAAPVAVRISGPDFVVLDALGDAVRERLETVRGVVEPVRSWRLDERRVNVVVDARRAARLGVSPASVAVSMQHGSEGSPAGEFHGTSDESVPIVVRYGRQAQPRPEDLLDLPVMGAAGVGSLRLRSVAGLHSTLGRALVTREQFVPSLELTALTDERALSFVTGDLAAELEKQPLPRGYSLELTGENSDLDEAKRELGGALAISVIAVYLLLVAQLRSFVHPLTIMASVPLTLSGVGAALTIAGRPVSMPVMVGLILLVGTVVNSAIILFDFVRQARARGVARHDALVESVQTRFRPIMMTSLSTIVGMIPLAAEWALGAERFSPLATAVIGGMITATLLTLIVIPALYDLIDDAGARVTRLLQRVRARPAAAGRSS
jgi:multidrug efflux pump subunit AcrB